MLRRYGKGIFATALALCWLLEANILKLSKELKGVSKENLKNRCLVIALTAKCLDQQKELQPDSVDLWKGLYKLSLRVC